MKKLSKKGFTLIELMIVLAIIAILAVVLIPKAGAAKDTAKNAGVTANVNSVRAFLEIKSADSSYYVNATGANKLRSALSTTFTGQDAISNPFTKQTLVLTTNQAATTVNTTSSIVVLDYTGGTSPVGTVTSSITTISGTPLTTSALTNKGIVYVYVCKDGFVVFGLDATGTIVNIQGIK